MEEYLPVSTTKATEMSEQNMVVYKVSYTCTMYVNFSIYFTPNFAGHHTNNCHHWCSWQHHQFDSFDI